MKTLVPISENTDLTNLMPEDPRPGFDGDYADAATLEVLLQAILNRIEYAKPTPYASVADAKAATHTDGRLVWITDFGQYRFDAASTETADERWIIAVTAGGRLIVEAPGTELLGDLI